MTQHCLHQLVQLGTALLQCHFLADIKKLGMKHCYPSHSQSPSFTPLQFPVHSVEAHDLSKYKCAVDPGSGVHNGLVVCVSVIAQ